MPWPLPSSAPQRRTGFPRRVWLAALMGLAVSGAGPSDRSWPGWGGPADDLTAEGAGLGAAPPRLELVWKHPLGEGYASIAVAEGSAVTLFGEGDREYVAAFDPATGEERWRAPIGPHRSFGGRRPGPASTPLIHDGRVFSLASAGTFSAHRLDSGAPLWDVDLVGDLGAELPQYGFASSPLWWDGAVLLAGASRGRGVAALEPASGALRWSAGDDPISYQTPSLVPIAGRTQLVVVGDRTVTGFDPASGRSLWSLEHGGDVEPTGLGVQSAHVTPGDGGRLLVKATRAASVLFQVDPDGADPPVRRVWESRHIKGSYTVAVHRDGYFYGYDGSILSCVDEATGELVWRSRSPGAGSPMLLDGQLVIATKDGGLSVAPASPEGYAERAALALFDDHIWPPPSFAGDSLYVRAYSGWARVRIGPSDE